MRLRPITILFLFSIAHAASHTIECPSPKNIHYRQNGWALGYATINPTSLPGFLMYATATNHCKKTLPLHFSQIYYGDLGPELICEYFCETDQGKRKFVNLANFAIQPALKHCHFRHGQKDICHGNQSQCIIGCE